MLSWLKKLTGNLKPQCPKLKTVLTFMSERGMTFQGYGGLVIHNLVVYEFGYLIRYLTDKKVGYFKDFSLIVNEKNMIDEAIKEELSKDVLRESEAFGYSREITEGNITNLEKIVDTIVDYVNLCDDLGVDPYGIHGLEQPRRHPQDDI